MIDVTAGLRAQALVQNEVHELRGEVGDLRTEMRDRFAGIESTLAQILERLNR